MGPKIPDLDLFLKIWAWTTFLRRNAKDEDDSEEIPEDNSEEIPDSPEMTAPSGFIDIDNSRNNDDTTVNTENTDRCASTTNDKTKGGLFKLSHMEDTKDIEHSRFKEEGKDEENTTDAEDKEEETSDKDQVKWIENYELVVVMDKVRVETDTPEYTKKKFIKDPKAQLLYTSSFENDSNLEQQHHFEVSENTTSVVTTTLTKGFTRGDKGIINLPLPSEVASSTAHFGKEIFINEDGKRTLRTRSWNAKKIITALPNKKTIVQLVVLERHFKCDFNTKVRLRGTVRVNIMDLKTGQLLEVVQNRISTVLDDIKRADDSKLLGYNPKDHSWTVEGNMEFLYGVEEKTKLWYTDLPADTVREPDNHSDVESKEDGDVEDTEDEFGNDFELPQDNNDDDDDDSQDSKSDGRDKKTIQTMVEKLEGKTQGPNPEQSVTVNPGRRKSSGFSRFPPLPGIHSGTK